MQTPIERETARRIAEGAELVAFDELKRRIDVLGYRLARRNDCRGSGRDMTTGECYPCINGYPVEKDTGISFAHYRDARRDANFRALQDLRRNVFAIVKGAIFDA